MGDVGAAIITAGYDLATPIYLLAAAVLFHGLAVLVRNKR